MRYRDYDEYEYDPMENAEKIPCPDNEMEDSEDELESLKKKIEKGLKSIGWKVPYSEIEPNAEDMEMHIYFEVSLKAGQTLRIGNKKITADRQMDYDFTVEVLFNEGDVEYMVEEEEYWSGRYDDYSPSHRENLYKYVCPDGIYGFYLHYNPGGLKKKIKMINEHFNVGEVQQFCEKFTYQVFAAGSRSSWKKKGGDVEPSVQRVALRYLQAGKSDYLSIHDTYASAMQEAYKFAEKNGYSLIEDDVFQEVTLGRGKPSIGKTRKHSLLLMRGGKMQRKALQVQVYGLDNGLYELNLYIL